MSRISGPYALAADALVFAPLEGSWRVLLIRRGNPPYRGYWAVPGGFLETGETLVECAVRELREETGLHVSSDHGFLIGVYDHPARDPRGRVIGIAYGFVLKSPGEVRGGDDAAGARWFPLERLPRRLAFDHRDVLEDGVRTAREKTSIPIPNPDFTADD